MTDLSLKQLITGIVLFVTIAAVQAGPIPVTNHSFEQPCVLEQPGVDPNRPAFPYAEGWIELDNDPINPLGTNTGVFVNITNIANTDANQIAFLGSEEGNALLQDLSAVYQVGKSYRLTVGVCVSAQYPPPDPNGLELAFYYREPNIIDVASVQTREPNLFSRTALEDYSVYLSTVRADAAYVGKPIGIAIRATGPMGGYWDVDNVRVMEYPLVPNFTDDTIVNFADFAMMAADWLNQDDPFTDVTGDGRVDKLDLLILAEYWLEDV